MTATLVLDRYYPFAVSETIQGWPASGFQHKTTSLKVRRVDREDHTVQVSVVIDTVKPSGRMFSDVTTISLNDEQVALLISALAGPEQEGARG